MSFMIFSVFIVYCSVRRRVFGHFLHQFIYVTKIRPIKSWKST